MVALSILLSARGLPRLIRDTPRLLIWSADVWKSRCARCLHESGDPNCSESDAVVGVALSAVFEGRAKLADAVKQHMSPALPLIGACELVSVAGKALRDKDALMVVEEGKPVGVITRYDLLGFLSEGTRRR